MILRFLLLVVALLTGALVFGSSIRTMINNADVIVVGRIEGIDSNVAMTTFRPDGSRDPTRHPLDQVRLTVEHYVRGSGPDQLLIPIFSFYMDESHSFLGPRAAFGDTGLTVWFLQKPADDEPFVYSISDGGTVDRAGFEMAPISFVGLYIVVRALNTSEFQSSEFPEVALADLFARNAAGFSGDWALYLNMLRGLSPENISLRGSDGKKAGSKQKLALIKWFDEEYPKIIQPTNDVQRFNDICIRLLWNQRELEDEYVRLYKLLPKEAGKVGHPAVRKVQNLLYFAEFGDRPLALMAFSGLSRRGMADRKAVLRAAQKRVGEDSFLNGLILRCIGKLYGMKELWPIEGFTIAPDLTPFLIKLEELFKKELPPKD